jgi:DNA-binding SARP family transcriptional activator
MLSVLLLGPPRLLRDDTPLNVSRRKSRALVYYLAAHERPLTREQLLAFFWPDLERPAAQQTLRTTLHGLRKALGEALGVDDDRVGLAPGTRVDTRRFALALAAPPTPGPDATEAINALTETLALYRGDFLEGFSLPDTPGFDDWASIERERYRRLAVRGLAAVAALYEAQRQYGPALDALERALAFDALQEDLQRAALRLHYLAGDRAGAIRRYAHLRQLLDEELGVLPMAETRALYDAIVSDTLPANGEDPLGLRGPSTPAWPAPPAGTAPPARAARAEARPAAQRGGDVEPPSTLPFVGREAELRTLRGLVGVVPARHQLALLEGEPGIGKTRLAEEFMQASGLLPLRGAAREQEQPLPYQPIIEALRGLLAHPARPGLHAGLQGTLPALWLGEAARLLPELSPSQAAHPAAPDESRLWEGTYQFLLAVARQHPLSLFIDDLQWADASTLALLSYLLRRARQDGAPIFFLGAARPVLGATPYTRFLQGLTREDALVRVPLARFGPDEIAHGLSRWLSGANDVPAEQLSALVDWLAQRSEGNPYVLSGLLRYLWDNGLLRPEGTFDPRALSETPVVPQNIYALIQARLARLSEPARRVLDAAVAAGRDFEFEVVYRAAGLSETAALDALDELRAAGLFIPLPAAQPHGDTGASPLRAERHLASARYAFDHNLTMEVAFREEGEPRHRLMHRRLAEALEQIYGRQRLDAVAGLLAYHFAEGNTPERAAPYAYRAGQVAAGLAAWSEAIAFYELALPGEHDPDQRIRLYMALGYAHYRAGQAVQSSEALRLALNLAQQQEDTAAVEAAQLALARSHLSQSRLRETIQLARELRAITDDPQVAASAEFTWATALSIEGADLPVAAEHLAAVEALLASVDEPAPDEPGSEPYPMFRVRLAQVKFELGSVAAQQGDLPRAVALYREALRLAEQSDRIDDIGFQVLAHNNLAYHLHLLRPDDPEALAQAEAGLRLAQEVGLLGLRPYLHSTLGEIALARGDLAEAEAQLTEGLALAERLPIAERVAGLTANLGRVAQRRGETALAIHRLSTALAQADALGTHHLAAQIRLWLAPLLPPAEARARLTEARRLAESGGRQRLLAEAAQLEAALGAAPS